MVKRFNKKAMEMGINVIVMLVIGITILGLVISFVTSMVGNASSQFDDNLNQLEEQDRTKALNANGYFAVAPERFTIESGDSRKIFVKIKNLGTNDLVVGAFDVDVFTSSEVDTGDGSLTLEISTISGGCEPILKSPEITIKQNDEQVVPISIGTQGTTCAEGDEFFVNAVFSPTADIRETNTITVEIKG